MGYRIIKPFDYKRLASLLRGPRSYCYATEEEILLATETAMFAASVHAELVPFQPSQQGVVYVRHEKNGPLEQVEKDLPVQWQEVIAIEALGPLKCTHYLYEQGEGMLLRKFSQGTHTVWVPKSLTDVLTTDIDFLQDWYRFELIRLHVEAMRVRFNVNVNNGRPAEWRPIAVFMPYLLNER